MFLLDDFVVTTKQRTNLKFQVRHISFRSAMYASTSLQRADFVSFSDILWHQSFKEGREDVEDDPSCGTILTPSSHKLSAFPNLR